MKIIIRQAQAKDLTSINSLTDRMQSYLAGLYGLKPSEEDMEEEHYDEDGLEETFVAEDPEKGHYSWVPILFTE